MKCILESPDGQVRRTVAFRLKQYNTNDHKKRGSSTLVWWRTSNVTLWAWHEKTAQCTKQRAVCGREQESNLTLWLAQGRNDPMPRFSATLSEEVFLQKRIELLQCPRFESPGLRFYIPCLRRNTGPQVYLWPKRSGWSGAIHTGWLLQLQVFFWTSPI